MRGQSATRNTVECVFQRHDTNRTYMWTQPLQVHAEYSIRDGTTQQWPLVHQESKTRSRREPIQTSAKSISFCEGSVSLWVTHSAPGADYPLVHSRTVCSSPDHSGSNFISFRVRIGRKNDGGETAGDLLRFSDKLARRIIPLFFSITLLFLRSTCT